MPETSVDSPSAHDAPRPWRRLATLTASLQFRATVVVVGLTLAATAAVCGYFLRSSEELARQEHERQLIQTAAILARAVAAPMEAGDTAALNAIATRAADGKPLIYVVFSDTAGAQLAVAQRPGSNVLRRLHTDQPEQAPVPGLPVFRDGDSQVPVFLDVVYPVTAAAPASGISSLNVGVVHGALRGYVRAGMMANSWQRAMTSRIDMIVGVAVLVAVVLIPIGFLVVRRIVSPMEKLGQTMCRFSAGELYIRSPIRRRDEVGQLANAFNAMADQHQKTHEGIVRLNAELEQRVAQRTVELHELASRDPLTALYNRRYFSEMLERSFSEASRYDHELSCMMIDLDDFKHINDTFGHHVGDDVLVLTAKTIAGELRGSDVAARFGGDEFMIQLPRTDSQRARALAERLTERFACEVAERMPKVEATMSIGIASLPSASIKHAEGLIRAADDALYAAKAGGKNRVYVAGAAPMPAS